MKKFQAFMEEKIGPFFTKISSSAFINYKQEESHLYR